MPNWSTWDKDEEIVLIYFLSCGVRKPAVCKLITYKCNTTRRDEQDIKHHAFQLHYASTHDKWNGFGPLLVPQAEAPRTHAAVPDVWAIDWKDSWKEQNVDNWLIQKTCRTYHLNKLTFIDKEAEEIICEVGLGDALITTLANRVFQEHEPDEIDYHWVEHRQEVLVERHPRDYKGGYDSDDDAAVETAAVNTAAADTAADGTDDHADGTGDDTGDDRSERGSGHDNSGMRNAL